MEKKKVNLKKLLIVTAIVVVLLASMVGGALSDRLFGYKILDRLVPRNGLPSVITHQKILREESVVIDVAEKVSPSVVTVGITTTQQVVDVFDPFGFFGGTRGKTETVEQDVASGFVIDSEGLIVTNKHVVSETQAEYRVITEDSQEYTVQNIYRDPTNDLAIIKINASGLKPIEMGDSNELKVGQFVIAIGTALGEFRHTVTTGVISGLGRGITAGSPLEGYVEQLDNVIQTDAAINPGNSGGPLLNSAGQVIGVNVAVAVQSENIGFALPINVIKEAIDNFNQTGQFARPYLGVRYRMLGQDLALMNDIPQGAYLVEVIPNGPGDKAGLQVGDILTEMGGEKIREENGGLAKLINERKAGEKVELKVWRDGKESKVTATLEQFSQ